jgi:hypothetical protein
VLQELFRLDLVIVLPKLPFDHAPGFFTDWHSMQIFSSANFFCGALCVARLSSSNGGSRCLSVFVGCDF